MDTKTEIEIHKDISYIKARLVSLADFIEKHMEQEELKFSVIDKSIARLSRGFYLLIFIVALEAFGVPISSLIPKLLAVL